MRIATYGSEWIRPQSIVLRFFCVVSACLFLFGCSASRLSDDEGLPPSVSQVTTEPGPDAEPADSSATEEEAQFRIPGTNIVLEMVMIPGDSFFIGTGPNDPAGKDDEQPYTEVIVDAFQISKFETSHDAYTIFSYAERDSDSTAVEGLRFDVDAVARPSAPYEDPAHGMGGRGYPAVGITQWAALHFAKWVSDKTGQFFRLPTEAEWELACRSGWNNASRSDYDRAAWFNVNSTGVLHRIGRKEPDPMGIHDLLGNAAEWTLDQYDAGFYGSITSDNNVNPWRRPERLHPRTVRGGSFNSSEGDLRCAARQESSLVWKRRDPQIPKSFWWNTDSPFVGFRLIRPIQQPTPEEQILFWQLVLGE